MGLREDGTFFVKTEEERKMAEVVFQSCMTVRVFADMVKIPYRKDTNNDELLRHRARDAYYAFSKGTRGIPPNGYENLINSYKQIMAERKKALLR